MGIHNTMYGLHRRGRWRNPNYHFFVVTAKVMLMMLCAFLLNKSYRWKRQFDRGKNTKLPSEYDKLWCVCVNCSIICAESYRRVSLQVDPIRFLCWQNCKSDSCQQSRVFQVVNASLQQRMYEMDRLFTAKRVKIIKLLYINYLNFIILLSERFAT